MDDIYRREIEEMISPGWFEFYEKIGSTNDVAQKWISEGAPDFSLVAADEQIKGRGRNKRKWFTLSNSALAFSLILKSNLNIDSLPFYTGLGAIGVSRVIERMTESSVAIKWPNDILLEGKKAVGILVEGVWSGNLLDGVILGIGINVTADSVPVGVELIFPATYIESVTSVPVNRFQFLKDILTEISFVRKNLTFDNLLAEWDQRLAYKNKKVYILDSDGSQIAGVLIGISGQGKLILELENGERCHFTSNEIRLRPFSD